MFLKFGSQISIIVDDFLFCVPNISQSINEPMLQYEERLGSVITAGVFIILSFLYIVLNDERIILFIVNHLRDRGRWDSSQRWTQGIGGGRANSQETRWHRHFVQKTLRKAKQKWHQCIRYKTHPTINKTDEWMVRLLFYFNNLVFILTDHQLVG